MNGSLETKYRWTEYGLTFTEKWNTDNTLGTEITVEDQVMVACDRTAFWYLPSAGLLVTKPTGTFLYVQLARGLKLTFDSSFSPNTG